jgi:nucleoside-diphosphate-sugar epimerase
MPRILLTGATGFIGRHCVEPLTRRGWEVVAVTSAPPSEEATPEAAGGDGVVWRRADLLDPEVPSRLIQETQPDALLHLAWRLVAGSVENYRWTRASLQLLMNFAEAGGKRAVFAGSCAEYDWTATQPLAEAAPRKPATTYGLCKNALGELFEHYRREVDLSAVWARIFFLFGPGEAESRLVASVVLALLTGQPAKSTHGEQLRDYLFVEDLADALACLVDSELRGPINVASGRAVRLKDLVQEAARQIGREDLVRLGAIAAREEEAPEVRADVSRLRDELEWEPSFSLEAGIERSVAWWRNLLESAR